MRFICAFSSLTAEEAPAAPLNALRTPDSASFTLPSA
eukprot:CAMPEP_0176024534 /NCGR_PEP_ID=MMETSP0120_2-20121206/11990_1 /TAXON_ID=160619 /ORGANISM="Kryptoperidinium foliaceum, Strain CCMP 1326" /LENGTH=36 /DNA_ID= /DNA_START= /DNA_END= /DNA_ORIENTATION=